MKNGRFEARLSSDKKEKLKWKAQQLGLNQTQFLELVCDIDVNFQEKHLLNWIKKNCTADVYKLFLSKNNHGKKEIDSLYSSSSEGLQKGEEK